MKTSDILTSLSIHADGTVAIARDCGGAYFAAYHRTDVPSEVKPRTALADLSTFH